MCAATTSTLLGSRAMLDYGWTYSIPWYLQLNRKQSSSVERRSHCRAYSFHCSIRNAMLSALRATSCYACILLSTPTTPTPIPIPTTKRRLLYYNNYCYHHYDDDYYYCDLHHDHHLRRRVHRDYCDFEFYAKGEFFCRCPYGTRAGTTRGVPMTI